VVALALVASANVFYIQKCWKNNAKVMERALAPLAAAEPRRTLLALVADHTTPYSHLPFLSHAVSYAAARRHLVDLGDYEAAQTYFPVIYRAAVRRPAVYDLETAPATVDAAAYVPDYIYTWKLPQRALIGYDVIA